MDKFESYINKAGYVAANVGLAIGLNYGIEGYEHLIDLPGWAEKLGFYGGFTIANLFMLSPIKEEGLKAYTSIIRNKQTPVTTIHPIIKTGLIATGLATLLGTGTGRTAIYDVGNRMISDMSTACSTQQVIKQPLPPEEPIDEITDTEEPRPLEQRIQTYIDDLRARGLARDRGTEDYAIYAKDLNSRRYQFR